MRKTSSAISVRSSSTDLLLVVARLLTRLQCNPLPPRAVLGLSLLALLAISETLRGCRGANSVKLASFCYQGTWRSSSEVLPGVY